MLESIRRAREAEEAESVARSAARRVPGVELTKPETMCRREPEDGDASPTSSVGSSTPEKPRLFEPAESAAGEVSLTREQIKKMSEVMDALTKSQKEAQEMSESVTRLAEEIKQLRVSRARDETVRAKAACVGGAQEKMARPETKSLSERIKSQGENASERRDSVGTAGERPLQRQSQGGGLYEEAKFFLANCARSATARAEKQPSWREMSVTGNSMEALYEQQISPFCLQCGAEGHWAAKCRSKEACLEGTQIMAASSGRRENRAEESGSDCEAGAELGR